MTAELFNKLFAKHLEEGHYGMSLEDPNAVIYLMHEFKKEIRKNPDFMYSQIKMKFNSARVYTSSDKDTQWETALNKIMRVT